MNIRKIGLFTVMFLGFQAQASSQKASNKQAIPKVFSAPVLQTCYTIMQKDKAQSEGIPNYIKLINTQDINKLSKDNKTLLDYAANAKSNATTWQSSLAAVGAKTAAQLK